MKSVLIDICTACGAKCKYCLHQYRNMVKPKTMSFAMFNDIVKKLKKDGYERVYPYLSGEPILNPEYWDMVELLSQYGIESNTASKLCFKIDWRKAEQVLSRLKTHAHFDITIDAADDVTQRKIAAGIDNSIVYKNLSRLVKTATCCDVDITVVTVLNRYNMESMPQIKDRVLSCGVKRWAAKSMGYYMGYAMTPEDHALVSDMIVPGNPRCVVSNGRVVSKMTSCGSYIKPVIGVNGEVTICCHDMLYKQSRWNINDYDSLDKIIGTREYQDMIKAGQEMKLDICTGCN